MAKTSTVTTAPTVSLPLGAVAAAATAQATGRHVEVPECGVVAQSAGGRIVEVSVRQDDMTYRTYRVRLPERFDLELAEE